MIAVVLRDTRRFVRSIVMRMSVCVRVCVYALF